VSGNDSCGSDSGNGASSNLDCLHDSAGASECQQKASVIVDGMECSGAWKTTTAATKHSIHSTSLQDILLTD
jgi:hypothetical protein